MHEGYRPSIEDYRQQAAESAEKSKITRKAAKRKTLKQNIGYAAGTLGVAASVAVGAKAIAEKSPQLPDHRVTPEAGVINAPISENEIGLTDEQIAAKREQDFGASTAERQKVEDSLSQTDNPEIEDPQ